MSPALQTHKGTNDRSLLLEAARAGFRVLSLAPPLAARTAEALFFTPPRSQASARTARFLSTGRRFRVPVAGEPVVAWSWGDGPLVVLVHGWGGLGGQLAAFGPPLVARGFRVATFDAPGHGASPGRRSSVLAFAEALRSMVAAGEPPHAVIAHSLGATATALALRQGLRLERAVFLGPPADPKGWTQQFAERFGIAPHVVEALQSRAERRLRFRWSDLDLSSLTRDQRTRLLVIHDRDDGEVPWADGAALAAAWPGAELATTHGLGHRKILRDPDVVARTIAFVAEGASPHTPGSLDRYLYDREARAFGGL